MKKPQIKPHFRVEIVEKLDGQVVPQHIDYVLDRLYEKGYLTDADRHLTPEVAAFWSLLDVEPQVVSEQLSHSQVFVTTVGAVDAQPLIEALEAIAIAGRESRSEEITSNINSLQVVLTDDYLQPELREINKIAGKNRQPWLLVKPVGGILWFGSIFAPGETGCWEYLADRALNFAATNAFQAASTFGEAIDSGMELDSIEVEKSPFCRLNSNCWDVKLKFFDSEDSKRAKRVFRFTIDVANLMPVTLGKVRSWSVPR